MFYEEKVKDGVLCYRTDPNTCIWRPKVLTKIKGRSSTSTCSIDHLLDAIQTKLNLPSRKAVLFTIGLDNAQYSRIRNGIGRISPRAILRIYDCGAGMSIEDIRSFFTPKELEPAIFSRGSK